MSAANSVTSRNLYRSGVGRGDKTKYVQTGLFIRARHGIFSELGILLEDKEQDETVHSRRGIKVIKWAQPRSAYCPVSACSYNGDHVAGCVTD